MTDQQPRPRPLPTLTPEQLDEALRPIREAGPAAARSLERAAVSIRAFADAWTEATRAIAAHRRAQRKAQG